MKHSKRVLAVLLVLCLVMAHICLPVRAEDDSLMLADAKKGVVQIWGAGYAGSKTSGRPEAAWTGTGFAVGTAGEDSDVFLTNWHVATGEDYDVNHVRVWILLDNAEIQKNYEPNPDHAIECEILYTTDGYPDLAVLKTLEPTQGFKALPLLSSEDVLDGARVYALGYPGVVDDHSSSTSGVDDITITTGIISKHMTMTSAQNTRVLMHDAHIQHGNSGGPLITSKGAVVGLNTYGFGADYSTEYSCAVSIDYGMEALTDLGIPFDVYGEKSPVVETTEETETEETEETTEAADGEEEEEADWKTILLIAAVAVAVIAVVVLVIVLVKKNKKDNGYRPAVIEERKFNGFMQERRPMGFVLRCPDGRVVQVSQGGMMIGRDPICQIRLPEHTKGVSRRHCVLDVRNGVLTIMDVGSSYGTFVNGRKIPVNTPVPLNHGSRFWLATESVSFIVQ